MSILSKLFAIFKRKSKKSEPAEQTECWYNNHADQAPGCPTTEIEGKALSNENAYECALTKSAVSK